MAKELKNREITWDFEAKKLDMCGRCCPCSNFSRQPCERVTSWERVAAINYGYENGRVTREREKRKCCCRQAKRCAPPLPPLHLTKLEIPQLPLNKSYCTPAALTSVVPCSRNGYFQASAGDNTMFPVRYNR